jgi:hypothetical protein
MSSYELKKGQKLMKAGQSPQVENEPRYCSKLCFTTTIKSYKAVQKSLKHKKYKKQASRCKWGLLPANLEGDEALNAWDEYFVNHFIDYHAHELLA